MAKNKISGLGRGLDAIFLDSEVTETSSGPIMVRISDICPRADQPRKFFATDALETLANSIAENGILQPLLLRSKDNGFYEIIAGERRWRASKMAGLTEVPAIITEADDKKAFEFALIENIQRENLNAIEEAAGIRDLMTEYGLTQDEVAKKISKSRSAVANSLRLLDLPDNVMKMVSENELSQGHARTLLGLKDSTDIKKAADTVISRDLSVRATEELVKRMNLEHINLQLFASDGKKASSDEDGEVKVNYTKLLEDKMSEKLNRSVRIVNRGSEKRIAISYRDNDDFDALVKKLCGEDFFDLDDGEPEKSGNVK